MGRVYENYVGTNLLGSINVSKGYPLDVKTVVENISDLTNGKLLNSSYEGLVVYVVEDKSLYVCFNKPKTNRLTNVEDGWRKVDVDYSVRIVESESNLTDGTTILFPFQGMMAYATSESALYILLTKGVENSKDINNWRKISSAAPSTTAPSVDKIGIDVAPEGGSGFKIVGNEGVQVDDYVNVENYIKASYAYTSKGVNSFDTNPLFDYETIRLSKDGDAYIELYANGDNWIMINDPDNTLGLSVSVDGVDYVSGTPISKETSICFGVDIKFHEGWRIAFGDINRDFAESDYELIDIYRSELSPMVYAYRKDIDVRMLTEDDLVNIDDKIDNLAHSIMIDLDDTPSEPGESDGGDLPGESDGDTAPVPLQQVIVQMNNSINKLEQTVVEPDPIEHSEIDGLFS